eukprot:gene10453-14041_t
MSGLMEVSDTNNALIVNDNSAPVLATQVKGPLTNNEKEDDDEEDGDDDDEDNIKGENNNGLPIEEGAKKKKKKKKKSNKKKGKSIAPSFPPEYPLSRCLGGTTNYYLALGQTQPPTRIVADLFQQGSFPIGEIQGHGKTKYPDPELSYFRQSEEEKREKERILNVDLYDKVRHASEVHRQVRSFAQSFIKPGIKLTDMCEQIEECNRRLVRENGLQAGIGFPTGCSLNHVAAHYTPNTGDETVLQYGDVMKIDFGTQID